nr:zinc finger, CCHC-type [Tanacetum cinerariifolium]
MHFLHSTMSVVYVLTTLMPEDGENATVKQIKKRSKWENHDYVCRVMEQYNELLGILGRFTQHNMNIDEAIQVFCIIDKLPPYWKDFKHTLKRKKEKLTLVELDNHLRIEKSLMVQDSDKPKGNNVASPSVVNRVEHNNSIRKPRHLKRDCKGGKVGNKANGLGTNSSVNGSSNSLKEKVKYKEPLWFFVLCREEVVDVVTTAKLIIEVVTAASETVTTASTTIYAAEPQVLAVAITTAALEDPAVQRYHVMKKMPQTEAKA